MAEETPDVPRDPKDWNHPSDQSWQDEDDD